MPVSKPQDIRNIAFLGHGGSGKTTLAEAMLHAAGVTGRLGSVADGTSHLDYSDIEKERGHSVDPGLAHLEHQGVEINLLDGPGYPDFIGGAISAMSGADVAVMVLSATAGIEVNTRRLFKLAQESQAAHRRRRQQDRRRERRPGQRDEGDRRDLRGLLQAHEPAHGLRQGRGGLLRQR